MQNNKYGIFLIVVIVALAAFVFLPLSGEASLVDCFELADDYDVEVTKILSQAYGDLGFIAIVGAIVCGVIAIIAGFKQNGQMAILMSAIAAGCTLLVAFGVQNEASNLGANVDLFDVFEIMEAGYWLGLVGWGVGAFIAYKSDN